MSNNKQIEKKLKLPHRETIVGINTIQTKPFDYQKMETMSNNKQSSDHIPDVGEKVSVMDFIILEIDNELRTIESLEGSEIMGRKISLNFAKRITIQAKAIHKEEMVDFGNDLLAQNDCNYIGIPNLAEEYYNEIFNNYAKK